MSYMRQTGTGAAGRAGLVLAAGLLSVGFVPRPAGRNDAQRKPVTVLDRYDFQKGAATQVLLAPALREISGLAVAADGHVYAHADERGIIAQIDPCRGTIEKSFALGNPPIAGDFEGLAIAGERFFLVTSGGHLLEAREGKEGSTVAFTDVNTGYGRLCEIEGLAYEPSDRSLLFGCKTPRDASLADQVTLLRWSLARNAPASPPRLAIPLGEVLRRTGGKSFHPSSVERDPSTGHYIIVAGRERLLLEVTPAGGVVATRNLHRQLHKQPEGLTFLGDSVMVVADEGAGRKGTLTCYRHAK
jgi:hypothetical protein